MVDFKFSIGTNEVLLGFTFLIIGVLLGFWLGSFNDEQIYLFGHFDTVNDVQANGFKEYCDSNNVCVTLIEESYLQKQLQQNQQLGVDEND